MGGVPPQVSDHPTPAVVIDRESRRLLVFVVTVNRFYRSMRGDRSSET